MLFTCTQLVFFHNIYICSATLDILPFIRQVNKLQDKRKRIRVNQSETSGKGVFQRRVWPWAHPCLRHANYRKQYFQYTIKKLVACSLHGRAGYLQTHPKHDHALGIFAIKSPKVGFLKGLFFEESWLQLRFEERAKDNY